MHISVCNISSVVKVNFFCPMITTTDLHRSSRNFDIDVTLIYFSPKFRQIQFNLKNVADFRDAALNRAPAESWNGNFEGDIDPFEIGKEHPKDHPIHENGVSSQIHESGT